jgi:hypothetical protein
MTVLSLRSHIADAAIIERPFTWSSEAADMRVACQGPNYLATSPTKSGLRIPARA